MELHMSILPSHKHVLTQSEVFDVVFDINRLMKRAQPMSKGDKK